MINNKKEAIRRAQEAAAKESAAKAKKDAMRTKVVDGFIGGMASAAGALVLNTMVNIMLQNVHTKEDKE